MRTTLNGIFFKARSVEAQWDDKRPERPVKNPGKVDDNYYVWMVRGLGEAGKELVKKEEARIKARTLSKDPKKAKAQLAKYERDLAKWKKDKAEAMKKHEAEMRQNEADQRQREIDAQQPYRGSDGHWYQYINDGRGGYTTVLSRSEEDRLDNEQYEYDGR